MKKVMLVLSTAIPVACHENICPEPEPAVVEFTFMVFAEGEVVGNMLMPEYREQIMSWGVTVEHNGKSYPLSWPETGDGRVVEPRAVKSSAAEPPATEPPAGMAFRVEPQMQGAAPVLRFGGFRVAEGVTHTETFVIRWNNGVFPNDIVTFEAYTEAMPLGAPPAARARVWLNGVLQTDRQTSPYVSIIKGPEYPPFIEFYNMDFYISVKNAAGENLLDPATEGHLLGQKITAIHGGERWTLSRGGAANHDTRAGGPAEGYGLRVEPPGTNGSPIVLKLGEFPTVEGCRGERFDIEWGDGTRSEVRFDCYVEHGELNPLTGAILAMPEFRSAVWIDGVEVDRWLADYPLSCEIVK